MKVAHVVTLVSASGAFGGPTAVATAQKNELASRGNVVHLLSGRLDPRPGEPTDRIDVNGYGAFALRRMLPIAGFSSLVSFSMLKYIATNSKNYDVFHVHLGRDLVTAFAATLLRILGVRYVVQPHGMIAPDNRRTARVFDWLFTRPTLNAAARVFYLTSREREGLLAVSRALETNRLVRLPNGVPEPVTRRPIFRSHPEFLFCSRLHHRKQPLEFVKMASILRERGHEDVAFALVGPDQGELTHVLDAIRDLGLTSCVTYEGPVPPEAIPSRLAHATALVLPSLDEPFPMIVLEALREYLPVILTDQSGISSDLDERGAALISRPTAHDLADAAEVLINEPQRAAQLAAAGAEAVRSTFAISKVADMCVEAYEVC